MKVLYDCNRKRISKSKQLFAELFPTVNEIFFMIRGNTKGNHFQGYQRFTALRLHLRKNFRIWKGFLFPDTAGAANTAKEDSFVNFL
jgi:hypothetical protein